MLADAAAEALGPSTKAEARHRLVVDVFKKARLSATQDD